MEAEWRALNGWQPGPTGKTDPRGYFSADERHGLARIRPSAIRAGMQSRVVATKIALLAM